MTEIIKQYGVIIGVAVFCCLEIIAKWIVSRTYSRLIKASKDMGHSKHRLVKSIRKKFETCYSLQIGVSNVPVFIEKYLLHYRVFGLHIRTWETFCNQCMLMIMGGSLAGAVFSLFYDIESRMFLHCLFAGIIGTAFVLLTDCLFGIVNKREILLADLIDYFENVYKPRLENEYLYKTEHEEYIKQYFEEPSEEGSNIVNFIPKQEEDYPRINIDFTKEEEKVIRDVIREYMG